MSSPIKSRDSLLVGGGTRAEIPRRRDPSTPSTRNGATTTREWTFSTRPLACVHWPSKTHQLNIGVDATTCSCGSSTRRGSNASRVCSTPGGILQHHGDHDADIRVIGSGVWPLGLPARGAAHRPHRHRLARRNAPGRPAGRRNRRPGRARRPSGLQPIRPGRAWARIGVPGRRGSG